MDCFVVWIDDCVACAAVSAFSLHSIPQWSGDHVLELLFTHKYYNLKVQTCIDIFFGETILSRPYIVVSYG